MHAYEILFSPTGGTAKVAAALTTDWSSVKTIDLSIPSTHYEDICLESDSLAVIAMPAFGRCRATACTGSSLPYPWKRSSLRDRCRLWKPCL